MDNEVVASDLISENTREFSRHILNNHFPNPIDGFKRVKRRILYTQPSDGSWFGGADLISNTIRIHNYGDTSIYDAGSRMVDSFRSILPLLIIEGKGGSYSGEKAAAGRYSKFRLSDFCREIFFEGINFKTIPMEATEDLSGQEIQYFIPKIPTALLYPNESIGFGYSSRTASMKFENICELVIDFVKCKDKPNWSYRRLAHCFVPQFPIQIFLRNRDELIENYRKGIFNAPIETEGLYEIVANNAVIFKTLAFGISPSAVRSNITKALKDKNHWLSKMEVSFDALSEDNNYIDFKFTAKRGVNIFDLVEQIRGLIRVRSPYHVINHYVFNDTMMLLDPPNIIRIWYGERYRSILGTKKHRQQDLHQAKMRIETYLIICEHVDEVIGIIKGGETETVFAALKTRFELSMRQCEILLNANLQTLMKTRRDELEARLKKTNEDIALVNESFMHIDDEICTEVAALKKKFVAKTKFVSSESQYIGCLIIGNFGIIQVKTLLEVLDTSALFNGVDCRFIPYYSDIKNIKFNKPGLQYTTPETLPTTTSATGISITYADKPNIFIRSSKSQRSQIVESYTSTSEKVVVNHVSADPYVVMANGAIVKGVPNQLKEARYKSADILYAFDLNCDRCIVISVNAAHPNVIRLQPVDPKVDKLIFSGAGETSVVGIIEEGTDSALVNLPEFHKNSFILIEGITKLLKNSKFVDANIRMMLKR